MILFFNIKMHLLNENKVIKFYKHCLIKLRRSKFYWRKKKMGTTERRQLEREIIKKKILEAANAILVKEGYENLSIRKNLLKE